MTTSYALFGCNPLAIEVAWRLTMVRQPFVLVDRDPVLVEHARQEGLSAQQIDYTDDDALRGIGIGSHIKGVFCLLGEDSENVFLAISARALDPDLIREISEVVHGGGAE
jgi:voltage-gated potassium channel